MDDTPRRVVGRFTLPPLASRAFTKGREWPWPSRTATCSGEELLRSCRRVEAARDGIELVFALDAVRLLRALHLTTAGHYHVLPAHAAQLYEPEVFGHTAAASFAVW